MSMYNIIKSIIVININNIALYYFFAIFQISNF